MGNRWGNSGNGVRLYFLGSKITADGDCSHDIKRYLLVGRKAMTNLDSILKSRDMTDKGPCSQSYSFSSHVWMCGLDLIDRVPDELWNEVRDIVQETGIKTIPIEKKCKKGKWLSGEALQIAVKRREAKSKGEKERYKHLNAEFQRIARR